MQFKDYHYLSEATIRLVGNSCQIIENKFGLTKEDKAEISMERRFKRLNIPKPPKRRPNDIKGFSKKSRLRLLKKTNRIDHENHSKPYFATLTYPSRFPERGKIHKRDLDTFLKRLRRRFPGVRYLWKLELQSRGAPHYHFMLYFNKKPTLSFFRKWLSKNWYEAVQRNWDEKLEEHLRAGTNCKAIKNYRQVVYYVSQYMSEECESEKNHGRYWGASRNWEDFIAEDKLVGKELIVFKRLLRGYLKRKSPKMAKRLRRSGSIEIWAPKGFIIKAYLWSKIFCEGQ